MKTKFTPDQKIQIVLESIKTNIGTAELCRKHNVHPQTFNAWRQKFMNAGKFSLGTHGKSNPVKAVKKENENLKRIIGELTFANDVLKKTLEDDGCVLQVYTPICQIRPLCHTRLST